MSDDLDALDGGDATPRALEPIHDAIQNAHREAGEHGHILTKYASVSEWVGDDGNLYLSLSCGADTKSWHARGLLAEGLAMIDQGDTFDTVLSSISCDEDEDSSDE